MKSEREKEIEHKLLLAFLLFASPEVELLWKQTARGFAASVFGLNV
jgi:hypothetical protein